MEILLNEQSLEGQFVDLQNQKGISAPQDRDSLRKWKSLLVSLTNSPPFWDIEDAEEEKQEIYTWREMDVTRTSLGDALKQRKIGKRYDMMISSIIKSISLHQRRQTGLRHLNIVERQLINSAVGKAQGFAVLATERENSSACCAWNGITASVITGNRVEEE